MAKKLQILRGTTAQNNAYTGSIGELTMDTEKVEVRIHDGTTQGGKSIGITSEQLNNKADISLLENKANVDLGNTDLALLKNNNGTLTWNGKGVVTTADLSRSHLGYVKLSNGLIIQWGEFSYTKNGDVTVTLPTAFTNATYKVVGQPYGSVSDNTSYSLYDRTTTTFKMKTYSDHVLYAFYIAVGF